MKKQKNFLLLVIAIITVSIFSSFVVTARAAEQIYTGDVAVVPGTEKVIETYTATFAVTERTAESATISIKWIQTIAAGYYDSYRYDICFSCGGNFVTQTVVPAKTWAEKASTERSTTTYYSLEIPISTLDSSTVEVSGSLLQYTTKGIFSASDPDTPGKISVEIPPYSDFVNTYTVSYDANGGTGGPASQVKYEGLSLTVSSSEPARNGYTFKGWATSPSAAMAQYQSGDLYTEDSDLLLYAVWSEEKYIITTDANGGYFKDGSSFKNLNYRKGDNIYPEMFDIPARDGYFFSGWTDVKLSEYASYDPADTTADEIYYAVWRKDEDATSNGVMKVSNFKSFPDLKENNLMFFEKNKEEVTTVIFNGTEYIGDHTFNCYPNLSGIIFMGDNIKISDKAFLNCPQIETVVFFGGAEFNPVAFRECSENIKIIVNDSENHPTGDKIIPYDFADGILEFKNNIKFDRYEFFDTVAAFCMEYDNIEKLKFTSLEFEDFGLYYYPYKDGEPVPIEGNTLDEGEITVYITENGENKEISFNELIKGIEDGSITDFVLSSTDKTHGQTQNTVFNVIQKAVLKALKWVVSLMNKVFKLIGKK